MPRYSGSVGDELMRRDGAGVVQYAPPRDLAVLLTLLDADEAAAFPDRRDSGAAAAAERVEYELPRRCDETDQVLHECDGLDSGVNIAGAGGETGRALAGRGLGDVEEAGSAAGVTTHTFTYAFTQTLSKYSIIIVVSLVFVAPSARSIPTLLVQHLDRAPLGALPRLDDFVAVGVAVRLPGHALAVAVDLVCRRRGDVLANAAGRVLDGLGAEQGAGVVMAEGEVGGPAA